MVGRHYSDNFTVLKKRFSIGDFIRRSITFRRTSDLNIARCSVPSMRPAAVAARNSGVKRGGLHASANGARRWARIGRNGDGEVAMPGNMEILWKRALGSGAFHVLAARAHVETIPRFRDRVTVVENRICGFTRPLLALQNVGHSSGLHEASQGLGLRLASQLASCSGTLIEKTEATGNGVPRIRISHWTKHVHVNANSLLVD